MVVATKAIDAVIVMSHSGCYKWVFLKGLFFNDVFEQVISICAKAMEAKVYHMKKFTLIPLLILITFLTGCLFNKKDEYSWNQQLTLVIDTPNGPVAGASVVHLEYIYFPNGLWGSASSFERDLTGEATVVDLGDGRYIFALLSENAKDNYYAFNDLRQGGSGRSPYLKAMEKHLGKPARRVPEKHRPLLVTFDDLNDPKSVREVDPDDLAASFGKGYVLREMTVQITDDVMSEGVVEQVLGWLHNEKYRTNPIWRSLDNLTQKTISGLMAFSKGSK